MNAFTAASIVPRGVSIPVDTFMSGISRFAAKLGAQYPVLVPRTSMTTISSMFRGDNTIYVKTIPKWGMDGMMISINGGEIHIVSSVDVTNNILHLQTSIHADYDIGTVISIHAFPVAITTDLTSGDTTFDIESQHIIVIGDTLLEVINGISGKEHIISSVEYDQYDTTPYTCSISISSGLVDDVPSSEHLYIRAYPAYISKLLPVPTQQTSTFSSNIGPFLYDFIEGRLHDGIPHPEVVTAVETWSPARKIISPMTIIVKNDINMSVDIPSSALALWDISMGEIRYDANHTVMVLDDSGDGLIYYDCVPSLPGGNTWYIGLYTSDDIEISIGFKYKDIPTSTPPIPGPEYVWVDEFNTMYYRNTISGVGNMVIPVIEPSQKYDRIEIGIHGNAQTNVILRGWNYSTGHTSWIRYSIVARVMLDTSWASSGIIIKPMFNNVDSVGDTGLMDGGFVRT